MKPVDYRVATLFVQERHYSPVMPKLTKHYLGAYQDDELVGILTLGWGTNPMGTIKKMFPELTTADYYEIGKMCMDDAMPRNSETQMMSATIKWMKQNTPNVYVAKGDTLYLTDAPDGSMRITPQDPEFARRANIIEDIMREDRDILAALAK